MKRLCGLAAAVACVLSLSMAAFAQTTYDTTYAWGGSYVAPWGAPDTATFGQTFIAPATDTLLMDFTFHLFGVTGNTLQYKAMVFEWAGSLLGGGGGGAIGAALFSTPSQVFTGDGTGQAVTINTGGVNLVGGNSYVALFTVSDPVDYANSIGNVSSWGIVPSHVAGNGGGGFVFYDNGNNIAALNTTAWSHYGDFGDLAWTANFRPGPNNAVPEPGTLALLGAFGVVAAAALRKRAR